jgi:hypothetical protein
VSLTRRHTFLQSLSARLLALTALFFLTGCSGTKATRRVIDGYKGKAFADPFLAMSQLLANFNFPMEELVRIPEAAWHQNLLVFVTAETSLGMKLQALDEVAQKGGHVTFFLDATQGYRNDHRGVAPPASSDETDRLLSKCRLKLSTETVRNEPKPAPTAGGNDWDISSQPVKYRRLPGFEKKGNRDYSVQAPSAAALDVSKSVQVLWNAAGQGKPTPAVTLSYGQGKVTFFVSASPFRNIYLGNEDHAALILDFVRLNDPSNILLLRGKPSTLLALLWMNYPRTFAAILLLVACWLWMRAPRFGPLLQNASFGSVGRFTDHLKLSGNFLWRRGQSGYLLDGLRRRILHRLRQKQPHLASLDETALIPYFAELTKIPVNRLEQAWWASHVKESSRFEGYAADLATVLRAVD